MKRTAMLLVALWFVLPAPRPAQATTYFGFTVGVTNAPPPPVIRMREPRMVLVSDAMVYVARDDSWDDFDGDVFRYGQYWFVYTDGFWYRGRSCRGPYVAIDVKRVPRAIIGVPRGWWKHHPMAYAASRGRGPVVAPADPPGRGRGPEFGPPGREKHERGGWKRRQHER